MSSKITTIKPFLDRKPEFPWRLPNCFFVSFLIFIRIIAIGVLYSTIDFVLELRLLSVGVALAHRIAFTWIVESGIEWDQVQQRARAFSLPRYHRTDGEPSARRLNGHCPAEQERFILR